jgi:Amt family ammonium transporter
MSHTNIKFKSQHLNGLAEICEDVLFWETNKKLEITYINEALLTLTGFSQKQVIGKSLKEFLIPDSKSFWDFTVKEISTFTGVKLKITTENGQFSYLNVSGNALIEGNEVIGYCGICTVLTENILSKQVIRKLQMTNKTIVSSLSEALIIIDNKKRIVVVSPKFNRIWGLNKGDVFINPMEETLNMMGSLLLSNNGDISLDLTQNLQKKIRTKDILKFKDGRIIERRSSPYVLDGKVLGRCWYFKDVSQQLSLIDKLGKLAFRDSLTKLYNRRWCEKKLKQFLRSRNSENLSFLYMDLDHFKVINDSCGHIHGDDVLEQVSQLLLDTIGQDAYLSRLGGDEFGLLLLKKTNSEVLLIAENIKQAMAHYTYQWKEKIFKIGVSIGIVFIEEEDDFRSVFVHADEACYISKETGRNKSTIFNANKAEFQKTKTELKWYDAIQKALLKGQFELWCQSINDIKSHKPHYEILLRMRNEKDELISPALFMGSADRFGMIFTIDKRVIDAFCQFYYENRKQLKTTVFSINISGHSIGREGFLHFVLKSMEKHKVDYENICFEITESEIIKNLDKALVFIKEVRKMGCKVSMDDFGKGLTSFSYLKNIPFDYIKIDGQFIKELNEDKINMAIIKSIVYIAEVMGKKTIAEHIENKKTLDQIASLGVDYFQGNYFSKPQKITELLE